MDFEDITLGEIEEIEEFAGLPLSDIGDNRPGVIKLRIGLAWIMKRRTDQNYTIEDARKMSAKELTDFLNAVEPKKE